ncbi:peptidyl-tRNA hydrolase 2, mitochondrial-like isoform X2 [Chrysoperla carnea]|uniref:peptidyl-tRNA hydrolase 2, mitochondrial-like isoform X2 n=1 Tax=Chrysoperla carnea TaxID=189513 RepID=UPI001D083FD3|nr:peptidyl-tRNA hydrolase 2, mitochondrial-like isoform X2 [Chrysoperla carnea]
MEIRSYAEMSHIVDEMFDKYVTNPTFLTGLGCGLSIGLLCVFFNKSRRKIAPSTTNLLATNNEEISTNEKQNNKADNGVRRRKTHLADGDGEYKMVLAIRTDLKMGKGKVATQCSHAAILAYQQALRIDPKILKEWEYAGQKKITVKIDSEKEMLELQQKARAIGILTSIVRDAGRTQVAPGSKTVLAIGPASNDLIDQVTGDLKLY